MPFDPPIIEELEWLEELHHLDIADRAAVLLILERLSQPQYETLHTARAVFSGAQGLAASD